MLTTTIATVRERLRSLAGLSPGAGQAAEAMADALDDALRVALLDLLGSLAAELTGQLDAARVEVRLDGRDATLAVVADQETPTPPSPPAGGGEARMTLRLPEDLKDAVTRAADRDGISVNAWIVRALAAATRRAPSTPIVGARLSGWARS
ncbi:toxin-antitoxin system HicB family antitoxin [Egicoccus sp. AB-alg6-2]|uniref:toxin-antitoxin system HicB family antitoxin n=1 Tax=Egicoccus sp. AB-alg6-2 TaxID=3242692 RepID=UPI00359D7BCC